MSKGLRTTGWLLLLLAIVLLIIFVGRGKRAEKRAQLDQDITEESLTMEEGENSEGTDEEGEESDEEEGVAEVVSTTTDADTSDTDRDSGYDGIGGGDDIYTSNTSYTASYNSVYQSSGYTVGVPNSLGAGTYRSTFTAYTPYTNTAYITNSPEGNDFLLTENIGVCDCGAEALAVQMCLSNLGYFDHPEYTGCFGRGATTKGLQEFQADFGINERNYANDHGDAYVGDLTMAVMNALCFADNAPQKVGGMVDPSVLGAETSVDQEIASEIIVVENDDTIFVNSNDRRTRSSSRSNASSNDGESEEIQEVTFCENAMITIAAPVSTDWNPSNPPSYDLSGFAAGQTYNLFDFEQISLASIQNSTDFVPQSGFMNVANDFDSETGKGTLYAGVLPTIDSETDSMIGIIQLLNGVTIDSVRGFTQEDDTLLGLNSAGLESNFDSIDILNGNAKFDLEWSVGPDFFAVEYTCSE